MLLAANIGNTGISIGVFDGDRMVCSSSLASDKRRSVDEYSVVLRMILATYGVDADKLHGAVISSVVRPLSPVFGGAVQKLIGKRPLFMGPGTRTGLNIKIDNPSQLGADIAACCIGALTLQKPPFVVLGLGDATTLTLIDRNSSLQGVMICPGVLTGVYDLARSASELTAISLEPPRSLFGKNTADAMNSGTVYGAAAMLEGLVSRAREACRLDALPVLATGAAADVILPYCRLYVRNEPNLLLYGLRHVYELNSRKS